MERREGKAIVFISHRMEEIFRIADRYTVLRNGRTVGAGDIKDVSERDLVKLMVDKASVFNYARAGVKSSENPVCLKSNDLHSSVLRGVSFDVREGELIGIGGLQGQGQRDLLLSIFGDIPFSGTLNLYRRQVHFATPSRRCRNGSLWCLATEPVRGCSTSVRFWKISSFLHGRNTAFLSELRKARKGC